MLKLILPLSLAFAAGAGVSHARADLLVQGSTFDLTLYSTADGGYSVTEPITVNGQPDQFVFGSVPVTVTEMDTPIGGGSETIAISVAATQDIFPSSVPGSDSFYLSIGLSSSPLQLSEPVTLTSALLTGTIPPPNSFPLFYQFIGYISDPSPWNGEFLGGGELGGFVYSTGYDVQTLTLDLTVDPIAEPASIVALLTGVAGLVVFSRKRAWSPARCS